VLWTMIAVIFFRWASTESDHGPKWVGLWPERTPPTARRHLGRQICPLGTQERLTEKLTENSRDNRKQGGAEGSKGENGAPRKPLLSR